MGRKISKERILELERQKTNKDELSRVKRKRIQREEKQKKWKQNLKSRGGFVRKKAKKWGEPCGYTECRMWEDGECQYSERDKKGCYLEKRGEKMVSDDIINKIKQAYEVSLEIRDGKEATPESIAEIQTARMMIAEEFGENKNSIIGDMERSMEESMKYVKV